jgi:hypothetical protein
MTSEECMRAARSVTLFLHGVGTQTSHEMAGAAEKGCWAVRNRPQDRTQLLTMNLGPIEPEASAFAFRASGERESHVVVPLVWCNIRARLRAAAARGAKSRSRKRPADRLSWREVSSRLRHVCTDVWRSADVARSAFRRFVIRGTFAALAALAVAIAILAVAAVGVLAAVVYDQLGGSGGTDSIVVAIAFAVVAIAAIAATCLLMNAARGLATAYDLIGDVAAYVGDESVRESAIRSILQAIRIVVSRAPDAQLILVGHSLGSALMLDVIARLDLPRRPVLVTLGSPLKTLHWWFTTRMSPREYMSAFAAQQRVQRWYHYWRDEDYVGRSLDDTAHEIYEERSLGKGGHADYWSDVRLWSHLIQMIVRVLDGPTSVKPAA